VAVAPAVRAKMQVVLMWLFQEHSLLPVQAQL
jgi:hypothetical protein